MENKEALHETLKALDKELLNPNLIQENKIYFQTNEGGYRVSMPTQKDFSDAETLKNAKYIELIQKKNTMTRKKLIEVLKKNQGIDIHKMENDARNLEKDTYNLYISLANKKDTDKKGIDNLKQKIDEVVAKRKSLVMEMTSYLVPAIEVQVENYYMEYLTSCCVETIDESQDTEVWNKTWKSFSEFQKDNSQVPLKALGYLTHLILTLRG